MKSRNVLPSNVDAEMVVIGSALLSSDALYKILSILEVSDFYMGKHHVIYQAIISLKDKGIVLDPLTLTDELILMNELDNVGGVDYLRECCDKVTSIASIDFYINIVKDNSNLRNLLNTIRDIDKEYQTGEISSIEDFIMNSEQKIKEVMKDNRVSTFKGINTFTKEALIQIKNQRTSGDGYTTGITSGYECINRFTHGFQRGEVTIVGARTSVGKTALSLNMAYRAARKDKVGVAIFSLEMTGESLAKRVMSMASNVAHNKITTGVMNDMEKMKLHQVSEEIMELPIYIDDNANSILDIETKTRQMIEKHPDLGLVVVDHIGKIKEASAKKNETRVDAMRKISSSLHDLAKELNIAILAVAQLNRGAVKGEVKRPQLSDIKECGSIEEDADVVILLYDEMYENNKAKRETVLENVRHIEAIVAKQRNGETGIANLIFYKQFSRYEMPTKEWEEELNRIRGQSAV